MDLNIVPAKFVKHTIENTKFDKHDENTKQVIGHLQNEKPVALAQSECSMSHIVSYFQI